MIKNKMFVTKIIIVLLIFVEILCLTACTEADRVTTNISKEADNFNVTRRIIVFNMRTDKVLFEMTGTFSIKTDTDGDLNIICQTAENTYQKHFVHINEWVTYVVEDVSTDTTVSKYSYELSIFPPYYPVFEYTIAD